MRHFETILSDRRLEAIIGNLLRAGVVIAATITSIGGVIYLAHSGESPAHYRVFQGEPADLRQVKGVLSDASSGDGRGIMQLGLVLLIATPVARVAFSLAAFAVQQDRLYVVVTLAVLGVLTFSMAGGHL
jgi:uncharacterized membrane protein